MTIAPSITAPLGVVNCKSNGSDCRPNISGSSVVVVRSFESRYASSCTILAYTPSDTLLTKSRPFTVA